MSIFAHRYGPNIANWILTNSPFNTTLNLKGIAAGNACWGGDATNVQCNGPHEEQNDVELFYNKALISKKLYKAAHEACKWAPTASSSSSWSGASGGESIECAKTLAEVHEAVGPHNIYNLYDNCPASLLLSDQEAGLAPRALKQLLRKRALPGAQSGAPSADEADGSAIPSPVESEDGSHLRAAVAKTGGYAWSCGGMQATAKWITTPAVQAALHLKAGSGSRFRYDLSGPASITLWPFLATHIRVLIYNGDADACVPYIGNAEWIEALEERGVLKEKQAWRPWYVGTKGRLGGKPPAGYVTSYDVTGAPDFDFSFATIRLAGHMVPTFMPGASLAFFERFLARKPI